MIHRGLITLFVAGAAASPCSAQSTPVFGAGSPAPSIKLKELGSGWLSLKVEGPAELKSGGAPSQLAGGIFGMMLGGGAAAGSSYAPPQYTRGAMAALGGESFLIVYRVAGKGLDLTALMRMGQGGGDLPLPEKLTPETTLSLVLVNVRSITTVSGIRPFNLQQEMTESARAVEEEAKLLKQLQQGPGGAPPGVGFETAPGVFDSLDAPTPKKPTAPKSPAAPKKPPVKK